MADEKKILEKNDWTTEELAQKYISVMTAITVPVNIQVQGHQHILDLAETKRILESAELIAIRDCTCRVRLKKCDAPVDVCIPLNDLAAYHIEKGLARKVSVKYASDVLERAHEAGLVQMTITYKGNERPDYICSCCSCCCHSMSALVRFGMPEALGHVIASKYIAVINPETCISCGQCVDRCQFTARRLENGKLMFDETKCFGCGVCLSTCPTRSISLEKRD